MNLSTIQKVSMGIFNNSIIQYLIPLHLIAVIHKNQLLNIMRIKFYQVIIFLSIACFLSCAGENPYEELILGEWRGHEWLIKDSNVKQRVDSIYFNFEMDSIYNASFVGTKQKGKYWLKEDKLYTLDEGKLEVMVRIAMLNSDTLAFDMNRGGVPEKLILLKEK